MSVNYLETNIVEAQQTIVPRYGMTADGYTIRSGAPTSWLVRLDGEKRFRRVMVWQFSNAGTCFLRIKGNPFVLRDCDMPTISAP